MPKRTNETRFILDSIKDPDLRAYVTHLSASLDKQNQELKTLSLNNQIQKAYFQSTDLQQFVNQVVESFKIGASSSLRILVRRKSILEEEKIIVGEMGTFTKAYAYLDAQIMQQLKDKEKLIISDTTKIHSIKFMPEKKYPKTIAAYRFMQTPQAAGYLWMSYEEVKEFTPYELNVLAQTVAALDEVCQKAVIQEESKNREHLLEQILSLVRMPVFVLNNERKIVHTNKIATGEYQDNILQIYEDQQVANWLDSKDCDSHFELDIANHHYQIVGRKFEIDKAGSIILVLDEDTAMHQKQTYLTLVMDTVSHDFKIPLINMKGFSDLLEKMGKLEPKQQEYLDLIRSGIEEMLLVTNDLFEINRIVQEGGLKLDQSMPKDIIERAVALIQAEARQKRVEFEYDMTSADASIMIDRVLVIYALYNLLNNAVKHSRIGGTIIISEKYFDGIWDVSVQDRGKGISQIDVERLKESNFITKEGKGLAIVNRIAKFHKGHLLVESELGMGSKFILQLPSIS